MVVEVWADNLELEMSNLQDAAEHFQHVAVEVLLPKVVAEPLGPFGDYLEYNYQLLRCNVDLTKALQITLSLSDARGARPRGTGTWRFNFNGKDFFPPDGVHYDLTRHHKEGINATTFGELLMSSGLVLSESTKWIAHCGLAGLREPPRWRKQSFIEPPERRFCGMFCFGYLLQLLTSQEMPEAVQPFMEQLDLFFPSRCDFADFVHHFPHITSRDPGDPLKRPLFCSAPHVLEAFFKLPEDLRQSAFERLAQSETGPEAPVPDAKQPTRRLSDDRGLGQKERHDQIPRGLVKING